MIQMTYKYVRNRVCSSYLFLLWAVLLTLACPTHVQAQDSLSIPARSFDQQALSRYRTQPVFRYDVDTPPEQMGLWEYIKYKIGHMLERFFDTRGGNALFTWLLYGFMIAAVVVIILNLAGIDLRRFLTREARAVHIPYTSEENISELNIDELISDAVGRKQWRLAVRYQYLKALRMLADRDLIRWRAGKTNMDYYSELNGVQLRSAFLAATDDFENVWYGNSEVTERHYEVSKATLSNFYSLIQEQMTS